MGMTTATVRLRKYRQSQSFIEEEFLVDSGAAFTVVPATALARIGVEPAGERTFQLANGAKITRQVGEAYFEYAGQAGTSKVIFGQAGDSKLLGALTLETLELVLDPLKRELKPLPMLLM